MAYTNQLGFGTLYGHDAADRKTAETNADSQTIYYTNSVAGDLLALRDGEKGVGPLP